MLRLVTVSWSVEAGDEVYTNISHLTEIGPMCGTRCKADPSGSSVHVIYHTVILLFHGLFTTRRLYHSVSRTYRVPANGIIGFGLFGK